MAPGRTTMGVVVVRRTVDRRSAAAAAGAQYDRSGEGDEAGERPQARTARKRFSVMMEFPMMMS